MYVTCLELRRVGSEQDVQAIRRPPHRSPTVSREAQHWLSGDITTDEYLDAARERNLAHAKFDVAVKMARPTAGLLVLLMVLRAAIWLAVTIARILNRMRSRGIVSRMRSERDILESRAPRAGDLVRHPA